ncbi:YHS domain-containing protein [Botrimarina mediterranea]|uniref:YHS domain-containing protein n=1 Tax=Botrimarina mediterranea TaxID=2528022 RepID=UPI00118CD1BA|nr:Copper-transporting P-type ATPase [Planctomycetes bacterium K2D]
MSEKKALTKDPICGMNVDKATAIHAERDGDTSYFCGENCRNKFLSTPADAKMDKHAGGNCCG